MRVSEREIEQAEAMVAQECATGIARARQALSGVGCDSCVDCGDDINPQRRAAMPSARRCARCQELREHAARRGAL